VTEFVFPMMGFSRHRMGIDGKGITTLVAAWGCPLKCRMCLNPQCGDEKTTVRRVTPVQLFDMVKVDNLYFQATGGGVTFGGGEPLAHARFIAQFRKLCPWHFTAETSLYITRDDLHIASECIDDFIVDVKDVNGDIYLRYTGRENSTVLENLAWLLAHAGSERVLVRVPLIPGYNSQKDLDKSLEYLRSIGAERFDVFQYRLPPAKE